MPIIVSRVAPGTPADLALPRLNEGDQVLFINGRDVSQHTHEQVRNLRLSSLGNIHMINSLVIFFVVFLMCKFFVIFLSCNLISQYLF